MIPVRNFLRVSTEELVKGFTGNHIVLFEDNVKLELNSKIIIVSSYFWEVLKEFPDVAIKSNYIISKYFTNDLFTAKSINKFLSTILKDITEDYLIPNNLVEFQIYDTIYKKMFKLVEKLYSELTYNILEYSISMNIEDILEIQMEPELLESIRRVADEMTVESIINSHNTLDRIIRNKPELRKNQVAKAYISGMINQNQMKQVLASRGFVTEIDSSIFKYPIANSYTLGMSNLYDVAVGSRTAAKALFVSNKAIQDSEYFARKLQLLAMPIEYLVLGNCGSTDYIDWYIDQAECDDNGKIKNMKQIEMLEGKYFFNVETNREELITKDRIDLFGKKIKLRSVVTCKHPDKHGVCSRCFGGLSIAVSEHFNLGHFCVTSITQKITQSILSTKHLSASADVGEVTLTTAGAKIFVVKNKDGIALRPELMNRKTKIKMVVSQDQCYGLKDLRPGMNVNGLNPRKITKIDSVGIYITQNGKTEYLDVEVRNGNRRGYIDLKFIEYILENGYEIDDYDNYVFDLSDWKSKMPIFKLPKVEFDFAALGDEVKKLVEGITVSKDGISSESPESLLSKLFETINSKLSVNLALIEVLVASLMVKDLKNENYDLGRGNKNAQLVSLKKAIDKRSMGAGYGFDNLVSKLLSPDTFSYKNKPDHPLDVIFKPNEVIKFYKENDILR